jgi:hypothetical protein
MDGIAILSNGYDHVLWTDDFYLLGFFPWRDVHQLDKL